MGLTVWALGKLIHKETFLCVPVCVQVRCYDWDADSSSSEYIKELMVN